MREREKKDSQLEKVRFDLKQPIRITEVICSTTVKSSDW